MNIAVYSPVLEDINSQSFIVETSFLIARLHSEHKFIIITDQKPGEQLSSYSNIKIIFVKPFPKNALLKKIWWDIKLPVVLKKAKVNLFISLYNACSLTVVIPQFIMIQNLKKTSKAHIKKARLLVVPSKLMGEKLIEKFGIGKEKIAVIYPSGNKSSVPINEQKREIIKNKYSEDKEFFLFNSIFPLQKDFINLLKSFSHFKKRQQSSFKLLIIGSSDSFFEKSLESYKYKNDVRFVEIKDKPEEALMIASAYAVVFPFNINEDMVTALNAMRSGVPVIAVKDSIINEAFGDAALYSETEATKDIGEKMMQVYTNEDYRSKLIEKGKQVAGEFTSEKAAEFLWQSIIKTLE